MRGFSGATLPEEALAANNEATSGVKSHNYRQILIDSSVYVLGTLVLSAVQGTIQKHRPLWNQHNTTFVDARKDCVGSR